MKRLNNITLILLILLIILSIIYIVYYNKKEPDNKSCNTCSIKVDMDRII
jgi:hypothetical protein